LRAPTAAAPPCGAQRLPHRIEHQPNIEFANLVQQKLDQYKAEDPSMGDGGEKVGFLCGMMFLT
jgi:hypothetical protein